MFQNFAVYRDAVRRVGLSAIGELLPFKPPDGWVPLAPGTISVKFSVDINGWPKYQWRRKIAANFNRLSKAHECYRRQTDRRTDGRAIAYSERKREFTFAKNGPFSAMDARYDATRADRHENALCSGQMYSQFIDIRLGLL